MYASKRVEKSETLKGTISQTTERARQTNGNHKSWGLRKCHKMAKYLKKKAIFVSLQDFQYILVYLHVCYVILITGCFNYF